MPFEEMPMQIQFDLQLDSLVNWVRQRRGLWMNCWSDRRRRGGERDHGNSHKQTFGVIRSFPTGELLLNEENLNGNNFQLIATITHLRPFSRLPLLLLVSDDLPSDYKTDFRN